MSVIARILGPGDEKALEAFLLQHADSSMILRSNLRVAGLGDRGERYQATYAAACDGDDITAVAAHSWNGVIVLQAPAAVPEVVRLAVERSQRAARGVIGPWRQVVAARDVLGADRSVRSESREILYALELEQLIMPAPLVSGVVRCRRSSAEELTLLAEWRAAYRIETMSEKPGSKLAEESRRDIEALHAELRGFVLERDRIPVAYSAFNAVLPDVVQVGGVWTPPALRGRGYARAVVAGSLMLAREQGVTRAILFTGEDNVRAQRAYVALGFQPMGDYGIIGFD